MNVGQVERNQIRMTVGFFGLLGALGGITLAAVLLSAIPLSWLPLVIVLMVGSAGGLVLSRLMLRGQPLVKWVVVGFLFVLVSAVYYLLSQTQRVEWTSNILFGWTMVAVIAGILLGTSALYSIAGIAVAAMLVLGTIIPELRLKEVYWFTLLGLPMLAGLLGYWDYENQLRRSDLQQKLVTIQKLQLAAEEANLRKSEFLAVVSHELRTPLNSINGFSDILLSGQGLKETGPVYAKEHIHLVTRIRENGKRLHRLINQILELSKIEANRMDIVEAPYSPAELACRVVDELRGLAKEKGLALDCYVSEEFPGSMLGDEGRVRQIIENLVTNAIKFTPEGQVSVSVQPQGKSKWAVGVTDTGVGIAPHQLDKIFEPFQQGEVAPEQRVAGTGLGLKICRDYAQVLGGFIKVDSIEGKGSTFTLVMPVKPVTADQLQLSSVELL